MIFTKRESDVPSTWTQSTGEEIANSVSHGVGFAGALIGTPALLFAAFNHGNAGFFVGTVVFMVTTLLLYFGSTLYHAWPQTRGKSLLRVFDHSAIFLLIAGTYTPFTLGPLRGAWGAILFALTWAAAIFGVILKTTRGPGRHPKLAMSLYLGMGWLALIAIRPLFLAIPTAALILLIAGGIAYTVGVLFYTNEHARYAHFVWHLFVLAGTGCHFTAVFLCAT